jgi:hypothetical protein
MRGARHSALTVAAALLAVALLAILASGCGSTSTEPSGAGSTKTAAPPGAVVPVCTGGPASIGTLRVSGVACTTGREVAAGWSATNACSTPAGASRTSCTVGGYRCLGTVTEHGLAVSCARPGRSISFVAKRS